MKTGTDRVVCRLGPLAAMVLAAVVFASAPAYAQTQPDAGIVLQEEAPTLQPPAPDAEIDLDVPEGEAVAPGGPTVVVGDVAFVGNTVFSQEQLREVMGDVSGQAHDMASLTALAHSVSQFYRGAGYPFARAYLPEQDISDGVLIVEVIEGRYGDIATSGDAAMAGDAQPFLDGLEPGGLIEAEPLERTLLILADQPGIRIDPIVRPGQEFGTGDLDVGIARGPAFSGDFGVDNHGNRYTGEYRASLNLQVDSPLMFGDRLQVRSLVSQEGQWLGSATYGVPLGSTGLRGQAGYAYTYYQLGEEFSSLDASGTAKVASIGLSYPVIRSRALNLVVGALYQNKQLRDEQGAVGVDNRKHSDVFPVTASFDWRDDLSLGAVTYGAATWSSGHLGLDESLLVVDQVTARSGGSFSKYNLDIARLQAVPHDVFVFGRFSGQWTRDNLDSSEGFGLGGPDGVRAYPVGEGYGDIGWLAQIEARYRITQLSAVNLEPFVFYDIGKVRVDAEQFAAAKNTRSIAGAGFGLRGNYRFVTFDGSVAWSTHGGSVQSDSKERHPYYWLRVGVTF